LFVLAIAILTAVTASAGFGLSKLFLVDRGWALEAIGKAGTITTVALCGRRAASWLGEASLQGGNPGGIVLMG